MRKKILVKAPALSLSGYGEQARFALRSLRQHQDKFDIFLLNIPWGKTGWLTEDTEEVRWMDMLMIKTQQAIQEKASFDISLQITIPNEFEKIASVNIGYTAGIETTKVAPQWIDKARLMDKIIVVSNHSKQIFDSTEYKLQHPQTGQVIDFKNTTPVEVVHFPVKKIEPKQLEFDLQTDFNFLSVVQWGPRKNAETTITSFYEEFKNDENVGLVMKVNHSKNCMIDRMACENRLELIKNNYSDAKCKVYLLHGNMTEKEMAGLYRHPKIKAIVTTTHGEGFGLPLFEAVCAGLPVIAPKWSGHVDFLIAPVKEDGKERMRNHFTTIDFDLANVNKEAVWDGVIQADSQWCYVKTASVKDAMRTVFKNLPTPISKAKKLQEYILEEFSEEKQKQKFINALGINIEQKILQIKEINGISFCIPTNAKKVDKTLLTINSIKKQKWKNIPYEIILCGDIDAFSKIENIKLLDKKTEAHSKKVSVLRNTAAENSKFENIVFCDDDILLCEDWLEKTVQFSKENAWDVLGNRILNPDGTRHWDKATLIPRKLVPYEHGDDDSNLMQTSGFFLIRKEIFSKTKWDETKLVYADREGNGMPEDVQFNLQLRKNNIDLKFNKDTFVWHDDDSYTEFNQQTLKKEIITKMTGISFFPKTVKDLENLKQNYAAL